VAIRVGRQFILANGDIITAFGYMIQTLLSCSAG
jgi:hypothetical protein